MSLKLSKLEKHMLSHHKAWLIGFCVVLTLTLAALYVMGSLKAWETFEKSNTAWYGDMKNRSKKVFAVNVQNSADRIKKQQEFDDLSATIKRESNRCNFNVLFSWQQFIALNKERMQKCRQLVSSVQGFGKALGVVSGHLQSEKSIAIIISDAAKTIEEVDETKWPVVAQQWADAEAKLRKGSVAASFNATKDLALGKIKSIQAAWSALIAANNAKDRAKYEEADAMLTQAYGTLDEITQSSEAKLRPLIAELELSYNKSFQKS